MITTLPTPPSPRGLTDNRAIARTLLEHARRLQAVGDNLYRIRAYRRAAFAVLALDRPLAELVATGGARALRTLPDIGSHLADTLEGLVRTGEFRTKEARRPRRSVAVPR